AVPDILFRETSTLGVREHAVARHTLERAEVTVHLDGQAVRIKLGLLAGEVVNAMPEWDDVAAAAAALGRPAKQVLLAAHALAHDQSEGSL
ncbi:MAG: DUF111 family protein, partial [Frankiales bacterium]|nr:DUF111 family protein [Frankiales bacterium]